MQALIVTDVLNDFVYGKLKSEKASKIIPATKKLILEARSTIVPVIYACDAHLRSDPEIELWGDHAMKGTDGAKVIDEIKPQKRDYVLEKRTYSAFHETGLDLLLRQIEVKSVVIAGLYTDICVRHSAADAFYRGYEVSIPKDCVESLYEENNEALKYLAKMYSAALTTSEGIIKSWREK